MELVCKLGGIATHLSIRIWRLLWQPIGSPPPPEAAPNYCFFLQGEGKKKSIIATSVMCVVKQSKDLEPGGSTIWRTVGVIRARGDRAAHHTWPFPVAEDYGSEPSWAGARWALRQSSRRPTMSPCWRVGWVCPWRCRAWPVLSLASLLPASVTVLKARFSAGETGDSQTTSEHGSAPRNRTKSSDAGRVHRRCCSRRAEARSSVLKTVGPT